MGLRLSSTAALLLLSPHCQVGWPKAKLMFGALKSSPKWNTTQSSMSSWWRNQMGTFSASLALCAGNSPVTGEFPHNCQWRGALVLFICAQTNVWVNNRDAGDLRCHNDHYDVTVMSWKPSIGLQYRVPMILPKARAVQDLPQSFSYENIYFEGIDFTSTTDRNKYV